MDIKEEIKQFCKSLGLSSVGFMEARIFHELRPFYEKRKELGIFNSFEEQDIEKKINPLLYFPEAKTIITIAFPYRYKESFEDKVYFSRYTRGEDYHKVVETYLQRICEFIKELGYGAVALVDSNSLPERYIASESGIGFIGKNNMLITENYGSYVFLGEIITDVFVSPDIKKENQCGECNLCLKACPVKAIDESFSDPNKCLSYLTQKKDLSDLEMELLNGRLFGCDTCQRACKFNKAIEYSSIEEFRPFEFMENIDIEELSHINKKVFNEKYIKTSCGWRGKNVLQRNALIALFSQGKGNCIRFEEITSDYVKEYYNRLFKRFKL